jgi:four helix bundle protein
LGDKQLSARAADKPSVITFQKLDVYQRSIEFLSLVREVVRHIPRGHADLIDQLRRSSQSIPQNIAEGVGKVSRADKTKYLGIARGSAMESAAHLDVMHVDELLAPELYARGLELLERIIAMLTKMMDF